MKRLLFLPLICLLGCGLSTEPTNGSCKGWLYNDGTTQVEGCSAIRVDTGTWTVHTNGPLVTGHYTADITLVTDFWTDVTTGFVDVSAIEKTIFSEHEGGVVVNETLIIDFESF